MTEPKGQKLKKLTYKAHKDSPICVYSLHACMHACMMTARAWFRSGDVFDMLIDWQHRVLEVLAKMSQVMTAKGL